MRRAWQSKDSVHLDGTGSNAAAVIIELHIWVIGEQRHRHRGVGDALRDHQRSQPLSKRVVMCTGMPDAYLLRLPSLDRANGNRTLWDHTNVAAARGARVLGESDRVQFDDARGQFPVFLR